VRDEGVTSFFRPDTKRAKPDTTQKPRKRHHSNSNRKQAGHQRGSADFCFFCYRKAIDREKQRRCKGRVCEVLRGSICRGGQRWFRKEPGPCPGWRERSGSDPDRKDKSDHRESDEKKGMERSAKRSCVQQELRARQVGRVTTENASGLLTQLSQTIRTPSCDHGRPDGPGVCGILTVFTVALY